VTAAATILFYDYEIFYGHTMRWLRVACAVYLLAVCSRVCLGLANPDNTIGYGELEEEWRGEVVHLSWAPRAFLLKGFLSPEECDHIINIAKPMMTKSGVVDNETGKSKESDVRTSTGTFFDKGHDEIIQRIEKRVAQVTMVPVDNQEGLQVLHYTDGQKYEPHYDYFHDAYNQRQENGGQRLLTVLIYLTTPEEGGETVFPDAEKKVTGEGWSECALQGHANKAVRGDAMMFYSLKPDGTLDGTSLHGSCPTTKGDKWSATKWIHVGKFGGSAATAKAKWGDCVDQHESCSEWAYFDECKKNPGYMMTNCRLSCKVCTPGEKKPAEGEAAAGSA